MAESPLFRRLRQWVQGEIARRLRDVGIVGNTINAGNVSGTLTLRTLRLTDGISEPDAVSGSVIIYIDNVDGELKAKDGDGNVSTLSSGL